VLDWQFNDNTTSQISQFFLFIAILLIGGVLMFFLILFLSKVKASYLKEKPKRKPSFEEA
jgi:threonine/homoserine/homoserine lactone efflux protein